jgi:arylsulfatase A-like enzyme
MNHLARSLFAIVVPFFTFNLSIPTTAKESRPNILFCIADDASWLHFGAYGCDWVKTPGFDRVAREGLLFSRAYTPNAKCAPSRACILTGRNSWQLEEAANHMNVFPAKFQSYAETLNENGYFTGKTGKGWAPGLAPDADGNPRQLVGKAFAGKKTQPPGKFISGNDYAANFADFLDARPADAPFCFWYGSTEPHRAYEYGIGIRKGGKKIEDIDEVPGFWPDTEEVRTDMLDYAFEIEYFDLHLARMLDTLEDRNLLENTLVVVTADNGMPFPRIKGQKYEYSNHLPLVMMWPAGITKPGRTIDDYISFIDFAPTFLEIAGIRADDSGMAPIAGRSLTGIFQSEKNGQVNPDWNYVLIGKERHDVGRPNDEGYPVRGIVRDGWLYLKNFKPDRWPVGNPETGYLNCDGSPTKTRILELRRSGISLAFWNSNFGKRPAEELYHIAEDPDCISNLAEDGARNELKESLARQMEEELRKQEDPRILGKGDIFDNYPFAWDSWEGFYERMMAGEKIRTGWVNEGDFEKEPVE